MRRITVWTLSMLAVLAGGGSCTQSAFDIFILENKDSADLVHIFRATESFGSQNRLQPGESRTILITPDDFERREIAFVAGRDGVVLSQVVCDTFEEDLDIDDEEKDFIGQVVWDGQNLTCE